MNLFGADVIADPNIPAWPSPIIMINDRRQDQMSKHPGPWKIDYSGGYIIDANGVDVARVDTPDPETRAILLSAREMWEVLQIFSETPVDSPEGHAIDKTICALVRKIESEIAAARKP